MSTNSKRMEREKTTVRTMIEMFCHDRHQTKDGLCRECRELSDYALARLDKCPLQRDKPTCSKCTVHCYKPDMRRQIQEVMRHSGPRMAYRHPVLAFHHLRDGRRQPKGEIDT